MEKASTRNRKPRGAMSSRRRLLEGGAGEAKTELDVKTGQFVVSNAQVEAVMQAAE